MAVRTRIDVAKEVAPPFGVTLQEADRFVLLVLNEIKAMLLRGDEVTFKGFGLPVPKADRSLCACEARRQNQAQS